MRKKLVFGGLVLLALVLTTGTFAYTYTATNSTHVNASYVDAAYNTVTPAGSPPNWNLVLPTIIYLPQYLYPNAAGSLTQLTPSTGTNNWAMVDDPYTSPDDAATYVYNTSKFTKTDLYGLTDVISSPNPIKGIKVHFRVQSVGPTGSATGTIQVGATMYYGDTQAAPSGTWTSYEYEWLVNPSTFNAWTETDVNALQAGIVLTKPSGGTEVDCTQVYIEVEYQLTITSGNVPTGGLFVITPAPGFTGDLTVSLYLVNPDPLTKAYRYLNVEAYLTDSLEAEGSPSFRIISLTNGSATFTIQGGAASTYYLNVIGGGYAVTSANTGGWLPGWSVFPQFFCEVSQR